MLKYITRYDKIWPIRIERKTQKITALESSAKGVVEAIYTKDLDKGSKTGAKLWIKQ